MKRLLIASITSILFVLGLTGTVGATDDEHEHDCESAPEQVELDRVVEHDYDCDPQPGDPCRRHGQSGVIDENGRCVCVPPPTTAPPTTAPPETVPGPSGPPGQEGPPGPPGPAAENPTPVVNVQTSAPPARAVPARPQFTG